ncbi:hypothetical protein HAX54_037608, partial [Datura stramonium]|nr:hypothetical protein [Datura stramonium]
LQVPRLSIVSCCDADPPPLQPNPHHSRAFLYFLSVEILFSVRLRVSWGLVPSTHQLRSRINAADPPVKDLLGIKDVTVTKYNPVSSRAMDDTTNDEHINCLDKKTINLQGEVECVRNFGKLPISNTLS